MVWYRYCPVNKLSVEDMDDLAAYDVFLRQKLDFPVIGNPENSLMEAEWFFVHQFSSESARKRGKYRAADPRYESDAGG